MFVTEENHLFAKKRPSLIVKSGENLCFTKKKLVGLTLVGQIFQIVYTIMNKMMKLIGIFWRICVTAFFTWRTKLGEIGPKRFSFGI